MEATILKYQQVTNKLMRQTALNQLEMTTKLMLVDAREVLSNMNGRFEGLCKEQRENMEVLRDAIRRKEDASL